MYTDTVWGKMFSFGNEKSGKEKKGPFTLG